MANKTPKKNEAPTPSKVSGASGEQLSFLPVPEFSPKLPMKGTLAWDALLTLLQRDLTHIDWLEMGNGWRLAATVKELDYAGWCPRSVPVNVPGCKREIARYSLSPKAKRAAAAMLGGTTSC